jgi:2-polyprenyl-6-hydroxyphenyl methylase/3-demethylubiquinone-9 3-methyltransferase
MTDTAVQDADRALKERHRTMWAWGDYPRVAADLIAELGPVAVEAAGIAAGSRVLDVAAGAGNASLPAARTGATVVACDLTPELLAAGRRQAEREGLAIDWVEADAESLPFPDDDFDVVVSVVGAMFAPHHQLTADEMVRVCRPGGTLTMINWSRQGLIGQLFATMAPYAPPPPPGARPPALWGDEDHVRELFGDRVRDLRVERRSVAYPATFATAGDLRDYYKAYYGPTIATYRALAGDSARTADLDRDFAALFARTDSRAPGAVTGAWSAEYLLVTATKN